MLKSSTLEDGTVAMTYNQTQGRGQMGAHWYFEEGKSLAFSLFKRANGWPPSDQFFINFAVCVGVKRAFDILGIPKTAIKWPNDILADGKKICGILVETQFKNMRMTNSVVGIGVNVNNEGLEIYPKASSMLMSTGIHFQTEEVMSVIHQKVMEELIHLTQETKQRAHDAYESYLFRKGEISTFENVYNEQFAGTIEGVGPEGRLKVMLSNQEIKLFDLKEIQLRY